MKENKIKKVCENCIFWRIIPENKEDDIWNRNQCRRYPPVIVEGQVPSLSLLHDDDEDKTETGVFPLTFPDTWCGEWKGE